MFRVNEKMKELNMGIFPSISSSTVSLIMVLSAVTGQSSSGSPYASFSPVCSSSNGVHFMCSWPLSARDAAQQDRTASATSVTRVEWLNYGVPVSLPFNSSCSVNSTTETGVCKLSVGKTSEWCGFALRIRIIAGSLIQNVTFHYTDIVPGPPAAISAVPVPASNRKLLVTWSRPADFEATCAPDSLEVQLQYASERLPDEWIQPAEASLEKGANGYGYSRELTLIQLEPFTIYVIRMRTRVYSDTTWSTWSDNVTTHTSEEVPAAGVRGISCESQRYGPYRRNVHLTWEELSAQEARGMILGYSVHLLSPHLHNFTTNATHIVIPDLDQFSSYEVQVSAFNSAGAGPQSAIFTIPDLTSDPEPPTVRYTSTTANISLAVSEPTRPNGYIIRYEVHWQKYGSNDWDQHIIPCTISSFPIAYVISQLHPGSRYIVRVTVVNSMGSAWVSNDNVCTQLEAPSVKLSGFVIRTSPLLPHEAVIEMDIGDQDTSSPSFDYRVLYCEVTVNPFLHEVSNGTACSGTIEQRVFKSDLTPTFRLDGLHPFTAYKAWLQAVNEMGDGPMSEPTVFRTPQGTPSSPQDVSLLNVTSSAINVAWSAPQTPRGVIAHYVITYNEDSVITNATSAQLAVDGGTAYRVELEACTQAVPLIACSQKVIMNVQTPTGVPSPPILTQLSKSAPDTFLVEWDPPARPSGLTSHYIVSARSSARSATARMTTTTNETSMVIDVDCSDHDQVEEFIVDVFAVNVDGDEELVSDEERGTLEMCGPSGQVAHLLVAFVLSCCIFVVSSCLALFTYFRCFKSSAKFDVYFADIVGRPKKIHHFPHHLPHFKPTKHEKEVFDVIRNKPLSTKTTPKDIQIAPSLSSEDARDGYVIPNSPPKCVSPRAGPVLLVKDESKARWLTTDVNSNESETIVPHSASSPTYIIPFLASDEAEQVESTQSCGSYTAPDGYVGQDPSPSSVSVNSSSPLLEGKPWELEANVENSEYCDMTLLNPSPCIITYSPSISGGDPSTFNTEFTTEEDGYVLRDKPLFTPYIEGKSFELVEPVDFNTHLRSDSYVVMSVAS